MRVANHCYGVASFHYIAVQDEVNGNCHYEQGYDCPDAPKGEAVAFSLRRGFNGLNLLRSRFAVAFQQLCVLGHAGLQEVVHRIATHFGTLELRLQGGNLLVEYCHGVGQLRRLWLFRLLSEGS